MDSRGYNNNIDCVYARSSLSKFVVFRLQRARDAAAHTRGSAAVPFF